MNGRNRNPRVSVVVPAHNEEGNIEPLSEEFAKVFNALNYPVEVVYVNDGSTDRTEQKMYEASRRYNWVRVMRNRTRLGLTTALARGFAQARGDILVFYPADLQFHPRDIPKMVEAIDNGADMVCGKKVGSYGKWLVSWIYNLMTRLLFPKLKVTDMNSVKAFTREVYNEFPTLREGWHRYLAVFAAARDFVVREVPVTLNKRHSGKSKFAGKSRIMKGFTDLIAVKFQVSVFGDPMNLFGKAAFFFLFVSLAFAAVAFYDRFILERGYRPLLYGVIFFGLAGLVTFVMGIITEALVYLRDALSDVKAQNKRLLGEIGSRPSRGNTSRFDADEQEDERIERFERERGERPSRGDRGDRSSRGDRNDRSERSERTERSDRGERRERGDRFSRGPRGERSERNERGDRTERNDRSERFESRDRSDSREQPEIQESRSERPDRNDRGSRGDRPERGDRRQPRRRDRNDRGARGERPERLERGERVERTESAPEVAPAELIEPTFAAEPAIPESTANFTTPEPELFAQTSVETPPADVDTELPSAESSGQNQARRTGRRMRRMRPQFTPRPQAPTETPAENSAPPPPGSNGQSELIERPLTLRVRELPRDQAPADEGSPRDTESSENV